MSEQKYIPVITSKKAQHHIAKIKAAHDTLLQDIQNHKMRIDGEKMVKEQQVREERMMNEDKKQQRMTDELKFNHEKQKHSMEQEKAQREHDLKMKEHGMKEREFALKEKTFNTQE